MIRNEEHNPLDEKLHDAFSELEVKPSLEVWKNVALELDKEKKRRFGYRMWYTGAGLLLLLSGLGALYLFNIREHATRLPTAKNVVPENTQVAIKNKKNETTIASKNANTGPIDSTPKTINKIIKAQNSTLLTRQNKQPTIPLNGKEKEKASIIYNKSSNSPKNKTTSDIVTANTSVSSAAQGNENKKTEETTQLQNNISVKNGNSIPPEPNNITPASTDPQIKKEDATESATQNITVNSHKQNINDSKVTNPVLKDATTQLPKTDSIKKSVSNTQPKSDSSITKTKTPPVFSIAGFYSPQLEKNQVVSNTGNLNQANDKTGTSFNTGIKAGLSLGGKIEVSAGISYSKFSLSSSSNTKFYFPRYLTQPYTFNGTYGDMSVPSSTMLAGFSPLAPPTITAFGVQYQYTQTVNFLTIPVDVRLHFNIHKFKFYITAGAIVQDVVSSNATLYLIKEHETDQLNYSSLNISKINFSLKGSLGLEYDFTPHFGVFLEPDASRDLAPLSTPTIKSVTYFFGCKTGLIYYF